MRIFVLASSTTEAREYGNTLAGGRKVVMSRAKQYPESNAKVETDYDDHKLVHVISFRNLQGVSFREGDEIHRLQGWAIRRDVIELEQQIVLSSLVYVPRLLDVSCGGRLVRSRPGYLRPPALSNPDAVRAWLSA